MQRGNIQDNENFPFLKSRYFMTWNTRRDNGASKMNHQ